MSFKMSQLDSKGVVGTTHLLKGQLIFVLCVCGMGVFVIWRQILEREMLIERVRVRMYVFFVITKQG